jgi:DeoR/GlpR family transcriptional regulator of sugar metabolism
MKKHVHEKVRGYTSHQSNERKDAKKSIAKFVVKNIIKDGMSIFLDAGSTVHHVGLCLFDSKLSGLTIMTNNMLIFDTFTKRSKEMSDLGNVLALTGGVYNQNHEALFGQTAELVLTNFNPVVVIIGASGFMVEKSEKTKGNQQGAFHHDLVSEVVTKKAIVTTRTVDRVIVCDFSKIGVWDASCFSTIQNLSKNARKCTIVTSCVPQFEDKDKHKYYEDLYRETADELKRSNNKDVIMVRVDNDGNPVG